MGELHDLQKAFTAHLRDPDTVPIPNGLDKRRVNIYSELIFNNLSALLSDFFPVIKSILNSNQWDRMVRDFFITHESKTPYFIGISDEFAKYLGQNQSLSEYPDFLPELAHYEWLELALYTMDEKHPDTPVDSSQLLNHPLSLSPLAQPVAYQYPVHKISREIQPTNRGTEPTLLLVLRDIDEKVRFFELQPLAFQLLKQIQETPPIVAKFWLNEFADQIDVKDKPGFINKGLGLLQSFNEHRVFISA